MCGLALGEALGVAEGVMIGLALGEADGDAEGCSTNSSAVTNNSRTPKLTAVLLKGAAVAKSVKPTNPIFAKVGLAEAPMEDTELADVVGSYMNQSVERACRVKESKWYPVPDPAKLEDSDEM